MAEQGFSCIKHCNLRSFKKYQNKTQHFALLLYIVQTNILLNSDEVNTPLQLSFNLQYFLILLCLWYLWYQGNTNLTNISALYRDWALSYRAAYARYCQSRWRAEITWKPLHGSIIIAYICRSVESNLRSCTNNTQPKKRKWLNPNQGTKLSTRPITGHLKKVVLLYVKMVLIAVLMALMVR